MGARRLIYLAVILLLTSLSCQIIQSIIPSGGNSAAVGGALLNEVLFFPAQGDAGFVEIKSPGKRVSLEGLYIKNERGDSYSLPDGVNALSPDQFLLILFDGTNIVEDGTIHASPAGFLNPESGFIELYASGGALLDRAAWGEGQPASVNLSRGGDVADLEPGTSIGRFPLSIQLDRLEWTVFSPVQVTAGAANPQPGVEIMMPLNGAMIKQLSFQLSWYPAAGALEYHVQVSTDQTFSAVTIDETVSEPALNVELQAGTYFWRVQALAKDGAAADFSPVQKITVNPGFSSTSHLAAPRRQTILAVPFLSQHKDTGMLLLESKNETGAHAWDVAHPGLDPADPADAMNCALASIAMINAYLGGDLTQDRIGYELRKDLWPGPEYDLNYGTGLDGAQEQQMLTFALDAPPTYHPSPGATDAIWADIQAEIDAGRPIFATQPGHAFVITGYHDDGTTRYVMINDPWWGQYAVDLEGVKWGKYFTISPASIAVLSEPEIGMDSDGDGIVDFDESQRFGTDPNSDDSDKDEVKDKDDVRASVYDEKYGYAITEDLHALDFDGDGLAMELDADADGGGCFDGMEDLNRDGKYKQPETYNFDKKDDACLWGTDELLLDATKIDDDGTSTHQRIDSYVTFSLHEVEGGKLEGLAQIKFTHTGERTSDVCSGTLNVGTLLFHADLTGEFQKQPDGNIFVSFQATPDRGPSYMMQWNTNCPGDDGVQMEGWYWGGLGAQLKDGVYDQYDDFSSSLAAEGESGENWHKIHIEQGDGQ